MDDSQTPHHLTGRPVAGTEHSWCSVVPGGTGITVLLLRLSRPIPCSLLATAITDLLNSHPLLRARLTRTNPNEPFFFSIPPLCDPIIETLSLSPDLPFLSALDLELNRNPWTDTPEPNQIPVFFATIFENQPDPGPSLIVLRFHTSVCDRTAAVAILKELMALLGGGGEGQSRNGENGVNLGIEDLIPKKDSWKPFWARGKDLIGYSLNGLRTYCLGFQDTGSARSSEVVRLVVDQDETNRILSACKERGIKLFSAITAAGLIATVSSKHLENNQAETYSVVTLVDCRKYLEPPLHEHNVGFYHSAIMNTHTVHEGEDCWEVAKRCHNAFTTATNNKKHLTDIGELNFLMCKASENPQLTPASSLRTALISIWEDPVIYESSPAQEQLGVEDYIGCASVHGVGPSIAVFDTIRDGQLDCVFVYPSPLHSRRQMQDLVEHMKKLLVHESLAETEEPDA
ncbi:Alcohol acetyltransferase/N-acetyltransferase protein [Dioscorea alata]|uniref:Alcohol acetyltransferase/N-acetyltransferase protein n=1 Tax=Dioscorea alata TaxID=55571 RepID=A0ACB7WCA7_DIOAL|nr:Alcohol acetyltransferase/N-acetyltransferase protein [Dioscorea alata]